MTDLTLATLGLTERATSSLAYEQACLVAATLDADTPGPQDPLPLLWHWAFFNPPAPTSRLGVDGHPAREGALLADFPRRMWVGGEVRSLAPLYTNRPAVRTSDLVSSVVKHGLSGDLLIVNIEHTIEQDGAIAVVERQDVVYRTAGGVTAGPGAPVDDGGGGADWSETITPTPPWLFRFSAITFNSHRIHYDRDYAVDVERYPGLVVHGPLTAMLLARSAARGLGRSITFFSYRASAPLFVNQQIRLRGFRRDEGMNVEAEVSALRFDGATAMKARAR